MPRHLKLYITGVVAASALALVVTTLVFPVDPRIGARLRGSWASPRDRWPRARVLDRRRPCSHPPCPVRMPRGTLVRRLDRDHLGIAACLGGPAAGAWVALLGTTEIREVRGRIPWYGTLANHAGIVLPDGRRRAGHDGARRAAALVTDLSTPLRPLRVHGVFFAAQRSLIVLRRCVVAFARASRSERVLIGDARSFAASLLGLAPIGWLMAQIYVDRRGGPACCSRCRCTRPASRTSNFIEMREMFTQTITALAGAVDKRDPFTSSTPGA